MGEWNLLKADLVGLGAVWRGPLWASFTIRATARRSRFPGARPVLLADSFRDNAFFTRRGCAPSRIGVRACLAGEVPVIRNRAAVRRRELTNLVEVGATTIYGGKSWGLRGAIFGKI